MTARSHLIAFVLALVSIVGADTAAGAAPNATSGLSATSTGQQPRTSFKVIAESPTPGSALASGSANIWVKFSGLLAPTTKPPTISPPIPGTWVVSRNVMTFTPDGAFLPRTNVVVRVPNGSTGIQSRSGHSLTKAFAWNYTVRGGSLRSVDEILAKLGYLPVRWIPRSHRRLTRDEQERAVFVAPRGRYVWTFVAPHELADQWIPGAYTKILRGALVAFQNKIGQPLTGLMSDRLWAPLLAAENDPARYANRAGYTYVLVTKTQPELLTAWHNGQVFMRTAANTGGSLTPTANGTFNVYLRFAMQVMQGTLPNGGMYADPVAFVAYFNGGDAIHYIDRADYGIPQSLGCVELPYAQAQRLWPILSLGTVVTVAG